MTTAAQALPAEPPAGWPARPTCPRCARPLPGCLCRWITATDNQVELLVLQHPMEVGQAKGSARLLQLSLQHCRTEVGETFAPAALAAWLAAPTAAGPVQCLLLYPPALAGAVAGRSPAGRWAPASPAPPTPLASPTPPAIPPPMTAARLRLVLLDGTWRKTRKMLALNPLLQALPRWWLTAPPPSRYSIRRAQQPEQRSTLEAACLALGELESQPARYAPLLAAFDAWVAAHAALAADRSRL